MTFVHERSDDAWIYYPQWTLLVDKFNKVVSLIQVHIAKRVPRVRKTPINKSDSEYSKNRKPFAQTNHSKSNTKY